jgi:uncharacterized protein (TIGR02118 family)
MIASEAQAQANEGTFGTIAPLYRATEWVQRATGLLDEQFAEHWRTIRAPLVRQIPGLVKATFHAIDHTLSPEVRYDAAIQYDFKDKSAYQAAMNGPQNEAQVQLARDVAKFMQPDFTAITSRECVIRALDPKLAKPKAKRIGLVGRKPGIDRAEFFRRWRDIHAGEVLSQYGLVAYSLNLIDQDRFPSFPFDGYAELWWPDWEIQRESSRRLAGEYAKRANFFHSHLVMLIRDYDVVIAA